MLKTRPYEQFRDEQLKNPKIKKAYDDLALEYTFIESLIQKRIEKKLTQKQLAGLLGTKQPVISRLEQGNMNPSFKFLKRIVVALDAELVLKIK